MSDAPQDRPPAYPPVATHRDGALSIKIWRNISQEGKPYYASTCHRSYIDKASGEWREARDFSETDLLKFGPLMQDARQDMKRFREADRANNAPQAEPSAEQPTNGLAHQRDTVMQDANLPEHASSQERSPER